MEVMSKKKPKRVHKPHYVVTTVKCQKCKKKTAQTYNPITKEFLCIQCYKGPKLLELCLSCGMRELQKLYKNHVDSKVEHSLKLIREAVKRFPKIAVACSWGKDSMVILHLARQIKPDIPIFTIMTPYKPKETWKFKDKIIKEWRLIVKEYITADKVPWSLHLTHPDLCCNILKVMPTKLAVKDLDCWITGLRNTEGRTRKDYEEVEMKGNLVKLNPILVWTEADVWRYTAVHQIPVNPLYAKGFRSLGCLPCSTPGGILERDGRWKGTSKCGGECGIHTMNLRE